MGDGVSEMRIDMGAGYRVYFTMRGRVLVVLLAGGDKSTQAADIRRAIQLADKVLRLFCGPKWPLFRGKVLKMG